MSPFNKRIVYSLVLLLCILGNHVNARDYPGPCRPYSADLQVNKIELDGLNETSYAEMSFDDIRLKNAYVSVFTSSLGGGFGNLRPEIVAALIDMRKRGDSVTPLLLKLMDENQETGFELSVLAAIPAVGTIKLEPYLDYARKVLRERTHSMSAGLAGCAAGLLERHGTKEDAELMKWVMETRPWVFDSVTRKLDELNRRLSLPPQESRPSKSIKSLSEDPAHGSFRHVKQKNPTTTVGKDQKSIRWIAWTLVILVAGGLGMLVIRKCFIPK